MNDITGKKEIKDLFGQFSQDDVPTEVEVRLRKRLMAFRNTLTEKERWKKSPVFPSTRRKTALSGYRLAVGMAVLMGIIVFGAIFLPLVQEANGLYAAVVEKLATMRTLSYTVVISPDVEMEVACKFPGLVRVNTSWGVEMISDQSQKKSIKLFHRQKTYFLGTDEDVGYDESALDEFQDFPEEADEKLGKRVIDGRDVVGFRVFKDINEVDVWIDPATRRLAHVDINFKKEGTVVHHMEIKKIRIDEPVEDSLFDLTPPRDYERMAELKKDPSGPLV